MLSNLSSVELTKEFKENFKNELRKTETKEFGPIFYVNRSRIRDIAIFLHERGANFTNIAINDLGEKFELIYVYFHKLLKNNKFLFISTEVDKKADIDSIELVFTQARFLEDELTKRYGLVFSRFTEDVEELFVVPKSLSLIDSVLNITPLGIYNKIHLDNDYFHIQVELDNIVAVSEKSGWLYRGITPLLSYKNIFEDNLKLTRRICYNSSYHHNLAYIMAIEQLIKIELDERTTLIRTLLCEFERFESHLIWFANLLFLLGYKRSYYFLLKRNQELKKLYKKYFNCDYLDDLNNIGYVIDIDKDKLSIIQLITENLLPIIYNSIEYFSTKKRVRDRCQGIGVLERRDAIDAGVTGPCLRSSGINYDIRSDKPYLAYLNKTMCKDWDVVTLNEGDVFARVKARLWELKNSYKIIKKILKLLIDDESVIEPVDISKVKLAANEISLVQLESSQGELQYYVKTADRPGKSFLGGIHIATPSLKNFLALNNYILKNNKETDFSLIVHSMDLNFNEIDL
jgi:Ni,Fe-hydrogenase III large subunit